MQYAIMAKLENTHWWFLSKREYIRALIPANIHTRRILDIGAGTGGTTQFLSQWGKVTGIEHSAYAVKYLKNKHIRFIDTSIHTYRIPKNSYDTVFTLDVLYHKAIPDDRVILKKIYDALPSGGLLCIADCALPSFMGPHDIAMGARTRYTKQELTTKVEDVGFTIIRSSYLYFFVFPLFVLQRMMCKLYPLETVSLPPGWINSLLISLCAMEAKILRYIDMPIGSSVFVLAKKDFR